MKYSTLDYAKALIESLGDAATENSASMKHQEEIAKNFLAIVRENGDEARLKKILDEASRLARLRGAAREVAVASARPLNDSQKKTLHGFMKTGDTVHYSVDPDLVAGVKITVNDEMQFDGTMKAKLDTLFATSL